MSEGNQGGRTGGPGGEEGSGWVCRHRNVSRSRVSAVGGRTHIGHGGGMNIFKKPIRLYLPTVLKENVNPVPINQHFKCSER